MWATSAPTLTSLRGSPGCGGRVTSPLMRPARGSTSSSAGVMPVCEWQVEAAVGGWAAAEGLDGRPLREIAVAVGTAETAGEFGEVAARDLQVEPGAGWHCGTGWCELDPDGVLT